MQNEYMRKLDNFYVAYFDMSGNAIYPSNKDDVEVLKVLMKNINKDSLVFSEDEKICYKIRIKRTEISGFRVQVVEASDVSEFYEKVVKASVDDITHLGNRKIARSLFVQYIEMAYRRKEDFAIIMADLDGFKNVNDIYGHTNGDIVLSEVSRMLFCSTRQDRNREQDIVGRIGGDEFIVILKNVNEEVSNRRAEIIRKAVEEHKVTLFSETDIIDYISAGTLSIGLYHVKNEELEELYNKGYTTDEIRRTLLSRCDSALYVSKQNGKNRVTSYSQEKVLEI